MLVFVADCLEKMGFILPFTLVCMMGKKYQMERRDFKLLKKSEKIKRKIWKISYGKDQFTFLDSFTTRTAIREQHVDIDGIFQNVEGCLACLEAQEWSQLSKIWKPRSQWCWSTSSTSPWKGLDLPVFEERLMKGSFNSLPMSLPNIMGCQWRRLHLLQKYCSKNKFQKVNCKDLFWRREWNIGIL